MDLLAQTIANSVFTVAFFVLVCVGFALVFGVMGVANYGHGEFFMLGAYGLWLAYGVANWPFWVAVLVTIAVLALIGAGAERLLFRRVRGDVLGGVIIGIGLMFLLQVVVGQVWGLGMAKTVPIPYMGTWTVLGVSMPWQRIIVIGASVLIMGLLWFFLMRLKMGRALRATALDSEAASLQGISVNRSGLIAMAIAGALAGAGGALMAPVMAVHPYMGHYPLLICFIVVIVGGAGNLKGAILASILFGFLHTFISTYFDSVLAMIVSCLVMFAILTIRPRGLLGYADK
jgi:branched-chain amino acid transport system permease protein